MAVLTERAAVATKKARIVTYIEHDVKEKAEQLASIRRRSLSNLLEVLIESAVREAEESGELPTDAK